MAYFNTLTRIIGYGKIIKPQSTPHNPQEDLLRNQITVKSSTYSYYSPPNS